MAQAKNKSTKQANRSKKPNAKAGRSLKDLGERAADAVKGGRRKAIPCV